MIRRTVTIAGIAAGFALLSPVTAFATGPADGGETPSQADDAGQIAGGAAAAAALAGSVVVLTRRRYGTRS
ncbi:hypothetical protein [Amycolatopsis sp. CA-230715]|uniref:hypothetical protein n=1 Tax=Amycolatopsis sp. CA-230715 TaxID=2745196 RepID=UPI001C009F62|nr:hypothetical protein [Amycolatopsis sp. CA-230715]QWF79378.1 hypothetical protein HUW46_02786 [Amycolatopsis sp. CA-230715]